MLLRLAARLPLSWFHALGAALGWIAYRLAPTYAARLRENLAASGVCADAATYHTVLRQAIGEAGKAVFELVPVWYRSDAAVSQLIIEIHGMELADAARARGRGILFLTPHLGCFEICARAAAQRMPFTALYRPPRKRWLEPFLIGARGQGGARLAPANMKGVRMLLTALKRGEAVGLLPDQAPAAGEGAWVDFFGRPAYTMTLARRLTEATGAIAIMAFSERLPRGRGYRIQLAALPDELSEKRINEAVEDLVRRHPAQYLWSYNRYKVPAGAPRPPAANTTK
jgi:KDO2-lipid IV(A) lauroyltransferase